MNPLPNSSDGVEIIDDFIVDGEAMLGGERYPSGTWFLGAKIHDPSLRKADKSGKLTGWSIGGHGQVA